jgi:hypothetical protein
MNLNQNLIGTGMRISVFQCSPYSIDVHPLLGQCYNILRAEENLRCRRNLAPMFGIESNWKHMHGLNQNYSLRHATGYCRNGIPHFLTCRA